MDIRDRPAIPPDIKKLELIRQWHDSAFSVFMDMLNEAESNLRKRNYPIRNAAVNRKDWREALQWKFRMHWSIAAEIENGLLNSGKFLVFGGYARLKIKEVHP